MKRFKKNSQNIKHIISTTIKLLHSCYFLKNMTLFSSLFQKNINVLLLFVLKNEIKQFFILFNYKLFKLLSRYSTIHNIKEDIFSRIFYYNPGILAYYSIYIFVTIVTFYPFVILSLYNFYLLQCFVTHQMLIFLVGSR